MEPTPSPHDQEHDQETIELLRGLRAFGVQYPEELLAATRAAFSAKVKQYNRAESREEAPAGRQFTRRLKELQAIRPEYPQDLLAARRAAFIAQVQQHSPSEVKEPLPSSEEELFKLFSRIKSIEPDYPPRLLAARRSAFVRQVALGGRVSVLDAWRSTVERFFARRLRIPSLAMPDVLRTSAIVALLLMAVFFGSRLTPTQPELQTPAGQGEVGQVPPGIPTNTMETARIICKPGYLPPLCLAKEFNPSQDLTFQGNGVARPAVAKDTIPGYAGIHRAAYINDGLYGPGSSWVSNSPYSWIKIDLGKATTINTVAFGRDRLGHLSDRNPGQFVIAVAMSDDIYADGNSSNDYIEYTQIYQSHEDGFSGVISGPETVKVAFAPVEARYVKIIFTNAGTAVDEVEVFMVQPPVLADQPTRRPKDDVSGVPFPSIPDNTPVPASTATPVPPTATLVPTDTFTPRPTSTPMPTSTPTDIPPTHTPRPTKTPTPEPTDTPRPTSTPMPEPTNTPQPTDTPAPTDTAVPQPTDTAEPTLAFTETPALIGVP